MTKEQWAKYPTSGNVPKPEGPLRMIEGAEYQAAFKAKRNAYQTMHNADPSLSGKHLHEIQPIKFGGSPTDPANKIALEPKVHEEYTEFWRQIQSWMQK